MPSVPADRDFTWRDGERTVVFREGGLAEAPQLLAGGIWERFELVTTPRALGAAPLELAELASAVHEVPRGPVPEAAATVVDSVRNPTLVALGGGRVIDTAKAIAAVRGGRVCALPTTLSGAEMTTVHRLPAGHEHAARHLVRPALVIADPLEMTTLDDLPLRASAMNSLAHGAEALYTPLANPVATLVALRGAELLAARARRPTGKARPGGARPRLAALRVRAGLGRLRPPPRRLPDACLGARNSPRGDQRDAASPDHGGDAPTGSWLRWSRLPGRSEPTPRGSGSGSRPWAAARDGLATWAPTGVG